MKYHFILHGMKNILKLIQAKKQQLDQSSALSTVAAKNLDEWMRIELTYASNAIEGNTLSRLETASVIEKNLTVEGKTIQEHLEAVNHAQAWELVKTIAREKRKITENDILSIHQLILQKIDEANSGRYRTVPVRIAGSRAIMPNPLKVPDLMANFIKWLNEGIYENPVEIAAEAHFKFVSIHPFTDGNGRAGRLIMNLILLKNNYPPAIIRKEERIAYINSLEKGQVSRRLNDYFEIIYRAVERSLDIYLEAVRRKAVKTDKVEKKLLKIGELASLSGESVATIRYWTGEGLLIIRERTVGGYTLYEKEMVERIKKIRKLQREKRLSVAELKNKIAE